MNCRTDHVHASRCRLESSSLSCSDCLLRGHERGRLLEPSFPLLARIRRIRPAVASVIFNLLCERKFGRSASLCCWWLTASVYYKKFGRSRNWQLSNKQFTRPCLPPFVDASDVVYCCNLLETIFLKGVDRGPWYGDLEGPQTILKAGNQTWF